MFTATAAIRGVAAAAAAAAIAAVAGKGGGRARVEAPVGEAA